MLHYNVLISGQSSNKSSNSNSSDPPRIRKTLNQAPLTIEHLPSRVRASQDYNNMRILPTQVRPICGGDDSGGMGQPSGGMGQQGGQCMPRPCPQPCCLPPMMPPPMCTPYPPPMCFPPPCPPVGYLSSKFDKLFLTQFIPGLLLSSTPTILLSLSLHASSQLLPRSTLSSSRLWGQFRAKWWSFWRLIWLLWSRLNTYPSSKMWSLFRWESF